MELVSGRQSLWHNGISGGLLGYAGVSGGHLGIPPAIGQLMYRYPRVSLPALGSMFYGGMGLVFGVFSGKRF